MQCPRCGLQNQPDITACARCGLPVLQGPPPGPAAPGGPAGYGPAPYGPPPGYGPAPTPPSYGAPPTAQQYPGSDPTVPAAPTPYTSAYGTSAGSPYSTGPISPYGATTLLPVMAADSGTDGRDRTAGLARLVLLLGVLSCAGYAIWALTARRGIFADFADNRPVTLDDAKTSDRLDTVFLIVAGAIAVLALALWLVRLLSGRARSGGLTLAGFVVSAVGLVGVVVGLVMSGLVGNGGSRVDEGQDAMTAAIVTGSGFTALALGLAIGCLVVGRVRDRDRDSSDHTLPVPVGGAAPSGT